MREREREREGGRRERASSDADARALVHLGHQTLPVQVRAGHEEIEVHVSFFGAARGAERDGGDVAVMHLMKLGAITSHSKWHVLDEVGSEEKQEKKKKVAHSMKLGQIIFSSQSWVRVPRELVWR